MALYQQWLGSRRRDEESARIWSEHAAPSTPRTNVSIGTVAGEHPADRRHPRDLRNVPEKAVFSWEPTALMGIYRVDEFWFDDQPQSSRRNDRLPRAPHLDDGR